MKIAILRRTLLSALVISVIAAPVALADFQDGMNFFKSGKYAESAAEFQALVDVSPDYGFGYYMLGLSFMKLNKSDQAITNLNKAIEIDGQKFSSLRGSYEELADAFQALIDDYVEAKYPARPIAPSVEIRE